MKLVLGRCPETGDAVGVKRLVLTKVYDEAIEALLASDPVGVEKLVLTKMYDEAIEALLASDL